MTSGHGDKKRAGVPGWIFFILHSITPKVNNRFSISYLEDAPFIFWAGNEKLVKIERLVFLGYLRKNTMGRQNLPTPTPSSRARIKVKLKQNKTLRFWPMVRCSHFFSKGQALGQKQAKVQMKQF